MKLINNENKAMYNCDYGLTLAKNDDLLYNAYFDAWQNACRNAEQYFKARERAKKNESKTARVTGTTMNMEELGDMYDFECERAKEYHNALIARRTELEEMF